ncbi:MAG: hypothetical protein A3A43_03175 [Candidatus Liptonbacteria bacterium RIFCSPLOWO2_01_FULL_56_20]|uniref:HTH deoR-type domain-containing protein n=1 Tax=Candidatus Liptonbacteria bacterium RIFCSPLOWO2_01_FULL_56_20 TaxID=1798652 RepID=A0A1G2CIZ4_9BACT|nr:MAG: hypothetical protein UY96_C0005G0026 [Parcubacteria group bacterium GW2011_GWB1_56_8]OGY97788.1 MAG: hypothetical protein A2681_01160 [Candidatus Liptonbacteria bacterium RIFCSPHIGHO2_01_FULL_56_18b]OGZ00631.1 MAG: hypothetical protein A3A43_03175 [Candidatus Liptonbacteria bacterium RIFCSPLOWO2_01_FULL_56_20]
MDSFPQSDFSLFCSKKAFEISYALFRVAGGLERGSFSEYLEKEALKLLDVTTGGEYHRTKTTISALEYLLRLGGGANLIHPDNIELIIHEAKNLEAVIRNFEGSAIKPQDLQLQHIFSDMPLPDNKQTVPERQKTAPYAAKKKPKKTIIEKAVKPKAQDSISESGSLTREASIRQSAILEKILQQGNSKLKDIQTILPNASERTIRYDLQTLTNSGLIERVGSSGPSTYYRIKIRQEQPVAVAGGKSDSANSNDLPLDDRDFRNDPIL